MAILSLVGMTCNVAVVTPVIDAGAKDWEWPVGSLATELGAKCVTNEFVKTTIEVTEVLKNLVVCCAVGMVLVVLVVVEGLLSGRGKCT